VIHSKLGQPCLIRSGEKEIELKTQAGRSYTFDGQLNSIH